MNRYATLVPLLCLALSTLAAAQNTYPWPSTGPIGIGTNSPQDSLDVTGNSVFGLGTSRVSLGSDSFGFNRRVATGYIYNPGEYAYQFQHYGSTSPGSDYLEWQVYTPTGSQITQSALAVNGYGYVGIGTNTPSQLLEVNGNARVDGSLQLGNSGVQITSSGIVFPNGGGTQTAAWTGTICGGDFAESVNVVGDHGRYFPGDVLVLTSDGGGDVAKSAEPYSSMVAGIYSTKPGTIGRRQTTPKSADEIPMAMVGIVPTKVSAENGPIHRGDLLVTASLPGYAMKGIDRSRMMGAVIGKAMGSLSSGTGIIEVLVSLQ